MVPSPREIVAAQAMKLSPDERADLVDKLWLSVHSREKVDAACGAEIARSVRQTDAGEVARVPWGTVMTELRAKLG